MIRGLSRRVGEAELHLHSFLTSALDRSKWLTSRPDRFTPRKEPWYQFNMRLGGPHSRSRRFWQDKYFLHLREFEPRTVQPLA